MKHIYTTLYCALAILLSVVIQPADAQQEWTQFLGKAGDGETQSTPPIRWDANNYRWQTKLPGTGWSSPVYSGNHVWVTAAVTEPATAEQIAKKREGVQFAKTKTVVGSVVLRAICVDLESGSVVHNVELASVDNPELINPLNSYASPTPAIFQDKVVCHFGAYGTWCLDAKEGKTLWKTQYVVDHSVGPGSSPVIFGDKVILVCDGIDKQYVAAVALSDGQEVWKTARPKMKTDNGEYQKAYSTPLVVTVAEKKQLVIPGAQWIVAYEPETGKEIWRVDHGSGFSVTPMASFEDGLVIFSTGFMRPEVVAVDPAGKGDVTKTHVKWRVRNGPNMPSMLTKGGKAYFLSDRGILHCANSKTGEILNRVRLKGNYSASLLMAGNHIYASSREGKVFVVKADETLELVATNSFEGKILATPAPVGDDLIFRVDDKLYRIGKTAG